MSGGSTGNAYALTMSAILAQAARSRAGFDLAHFPGAKVMLQTAGTIAPGPNSSVYAFGKISSRRNLYRIPVR